MTDASNDLLVKLEALKAALDAGFSGVNGKIDSVHGRLDRVHGKLDERFAEVHTKLDEIRKDIKILSDGLLSPSEQKQIRTWPRPVDADDLKEG